MTDTERLADIIVREWYQTEGYRGAAGSLAAILVAAGVTLAPDPAPAEVIDRLQRALRVATHAPHDQDGDPVEGFPACSVCGAIQTAPDPAPLDEFIDAFDAVGKVVEPFAIKGFYKMWERLRDAAYALVRVTIAPCLDCPASSCAGCTWALKGDLAGAYRPLKSYSWLRWPSEYTEDDPDWAAMVSPIDDKDGGHDDR